MPATMVTRRSVFESLHKEHGDVILSLGRYGWQRHLPLKADDPNGVIRNPNGVWPTANLRKNSSPTFVPATSAS